MKELKKFKIVYRDQGKEKTVVLKAAYYKRRGTTFIFYDEYDEYVQEFEKEDLKDIFPEGASNYI